MKTMKTLCGVRVGNIKDPNPETRGKAGLVELPFPEMGEQDVLIKVAYCAICGSDPHAIGGCFGQPQGCTDPIPLGHEISGVIEKIGPKATIKGLKVGDRVAGNFRRPCGTCYYCQNEQEQFCRQARLYNRPGMAPYIIWHEDQVYKLPDSISLKEGCLLEPLSIVTRMMDKCRLKVGQRALVCGGGPIGLMAIQMLNIYGAASLTLVEPIEERRKLAESMGAKYTINPLEENQLEKAMEYTDGKGYDVVLDCSGSVHAVEQLLDVAANGGLVLYGAMYPNDFKLPLNLQKYLYMKELTLSGVFVAPYAFPRALQMLERIDLKPYIDTVFDLDDGAAAFEAQATGKHIKILIQCNKDLE